MSFIETIVGNSILSFVPAHQAKLIVKTLNSKLYALSENANEFFIFNQ